MSPSGKKNAKKFVSKVKNAGFWQKFNSRVRSRSTKKSSGSRPDSRELRGHEHPKEPERNKK